MSKRRCVYIDTDNHSPDVITVHHGAAEPTYICGYHEQSRGVPSEYAARIKRGHQRTKIIDRAKKLERMARVQRAADREGVIGS